MSDMTRRWEDHPGRGTDGCLTVSGRHGQATIGAVTDAPTAGAVHVWYGPPQGRAPLLLVDPLQGDPTITVAELIGATPEEGR
ncbi:hypothetical protein ACFVWN_01095 [Nocardiopsis flavescens]|uniref:hypothetical protein n=1 Tax=Nocardiopsis flavescens TaxID=758803 RepID=UPI00365AF407